MQNVNKETICPKISRSVMRQIDITDYQSAGGKGTLDFRLLRKNRMGVQMETMKEGDGVTFPQKGQKVSCSSHI